MIMSFLGRTTQGKYDQREGNYLGLLCEKMGMLKCKCEFYSV